MELFDQEYSQEDQPDFINPMEEVSDDLLEMLVTDESQYSSVYRPIGPPDCGGFD